MSSWRRRPIYRTSACCTASCWPVCAQPAGLEPATSCSHTSRPWSPTCTSYRRGRQLGAARNRRRATPSLHMTIMETVGFCLHLSTFLGVLQTVLISAKKSCCIVLEGTPFAICLCDKDRSVWLMTIWPVQNHCNIHMQVCHDVIINKSNVLW